MQHARVRIDGQRLGADAGAAAERLQARECCRAPAGKAPAARERWERRRSAAAAPAVVWSAALARRAMRRATASESTSSSGAVEGSFGRSCVWCSARVRAETAWPKALTGLSSSLEMSLLASSRFSSRSDAPRSLGGGMRRRVLVEPVCVQRAVVEAEIGGRIDLHLHVVFADAQDVAALQFVRVLVAERRSLSLTKVPLLLVSCSR